MKIKSIFTWLLLLATVLPMTISAQKKDDSRYMEGAVPEVDGRVVFSKSFVINGMSKSEIYNRMLDYFTDRLAKNNDPLSRVAYTDKDNGEIVGLSNEWIVFSQSALSLDRTKAKFQIAAFCSDGNCKVEITKISFTYRETEKYTAEEWITDKYALNKTKTKLVRGLAKWRRKTVDLFDSYFKEIKEALSAQPVEKVVKKEVAKPVETSTGTEVINLKPAETPKTVEKAQPVETPKPVEEKQVANTTPVVSEPINQTNDLRSIKPSEVQDRMTSEMYSCKTLILTGDKPITADKGISIGFMAGKPVAFVYFNEKENVDKITSDKNYTIRLYDANAKKVKMQLKCKVISSKIENGSRVVAGEILTASAE